MTYDMDTNGDIYSQINLNKMAKIEKFKNFAKRFQSKWNTDTPTEINLPSYTDELEEKDRIEIENNIENNVIEESFNKFIYYFYK